MNPRIFVPVVAAAAFAVSAVTLHARSTESNVGKEVKKLDVKFIENKPEATAGQPMIVEFWATWCPPCRASIPHMNGIHAKFKDKGLVIVGITKEDKKTVEKFLKEVPMNYAVAQDDNGKMNKEFGVTGIPHALLVDKAGKVVWEGHPMELKDAEIEKLIGS